MSGSETLADWLRAAIDRDAEIAEAAGGTWTHECQHVDDNNQYYNDANPHPDCCRVGGSILIYDEGGHDVADAEHMIRFDPARVLRDVAAKRRILEQHQPVKFTDVTLDIRDAVVCFACHAHLDEPDDWPDDQEWAYPLVQQAWPCPTVDALAQSYRGEPGWREEWDLEV